MEKTIVNNILREFEKGQIVSLKLDRGNGPFTKLARFDGFDRNDNPLLYLTGEIPLDIDKIGGYSSIRYLQDEYPDGARR